MTNNEFIHTEISEVLFKSSDLLAIKLIRTITNKYFFTCFNNFKKFIGLQYYVNENFILTTLDNSHDKNLDQYINCVQSHNNILFSDIKKLNIKTTSTQESNQLFTNHFIIGWLYVYYFCDYFSSFYFKEINTNINNCETQKYLMTDSFQKKKRWNLFNNFLDKNYSNNQDKREIIKAVKEHSSNYLKILNEGL